MSAAELAFRYAVPALAACALLAWLAPAGAQDADAKIDVARVRAADGRRTDRADLAGVERFYRKALEDATAAVAAVARKFQAPAPQDVRPAAYKTGVPRARGTVTRNVAFKCPVPPELRGAEVYFVSVPRGGARPRILSDGALARNAVIFVVEAESLADVSELARRLGRPVTLASKELARALGVEAADARVAISSDGRGAVVTEAAP